jgi:hypothetical protein
MILYGCCCWLGDRVTRPCLDLAMRAHRVHLCGRLRRRGGTSLLLENNQRRAHIHTYEGSITQPPLSTCAPLSFDETTLPAGIVFGTSNRWTRSRHARSAIATEKSALLMFNGPASDKNTNKCRRTHLSFSLYSALRISIKLKSGSAFLAEQVPTHTQLKF